MDFYKRELSERQLYKFPPFYFLLEVSCSRASSESAATAAKAIAQQLQTVGAGKNITIEGPSPHFIEKVGGRFNWHLIIKSQSRQDLLEVIKVLPKTCTYDIDPTDLL